MTELSQSTMAGYGWKEVYLGGTRTWENEIFRRYAAKIVQIQAKIRVNKGASRIRRAQHAKILAGVTNAEFRIVPDLPDDLRGDFFRAGANYPATVRFSNCSGEVQPDSHKDLRGVGIRVSSQHGSQDFLVTNAPASHARDPQQFMAVAEALASKSQIFVLLRMILSLGVSETIRVLRVLRQGTSHRVDSLASERFWSRAPIAFGPCAVKYVLEPFKPAAASAPPAGDDYLRDEFRERLKRGPVTFSFKVQRFMDEHSTPIEDGSVEWKESTSPVQTLAHLVIPQQDLGTSTARQTEELVDNLAFNPWNSVEGFRPLGSLNRARRRVYQASANYRLAKAHP
jgi:hypothetical protein